MRPIRRRARPLPALVAFVLAVLIAGCAPAAPAVAPNGMPTEAPNAAEVVEGQFYRPTALRFAAISGADEESSAARLAPARPVAATRPEPGPSGRDRGSRGRSRGGPARCAAPGHRSPWSSG